MRKGDVVDQVDLFPSPARDVLRDFIDQQEVMEKILTHLGVWPAIAPGPPETSAA